MDNQFPLLTTEQINDTTDRLLKLGASMHMFAREIESAARAPLLAEIERLIDIGASLMGKINRLTDERDAAMVDAERYRCIRDADRSDCITQELGMYAMESLDEYVDAAMEDEARNASRKEAANG